MSTLLFPRQSLVLLGKEAGPFEAAGKDVAGVIKSVDEKLAAVGVVPEKLKAQCKGCPSVSTNYSSHTISSLCTHTQRWVGFEITVWW